MSWKIVADSAADINKNYQPDGDVAIAEVPLSIQVGMNEYVDTHDLDRDQLLEAMYNEHSASTSSCPSPKMFADAYEDADNIIVVTMSHKLSGTYNAANLAKRMTLEKYPNKKIHIVDSLGTSGVEHLLVEKANELINQGKSFEEVVDELEKYRDSIFTLFTLSNYDNLIKNGRMSKLTGLLAKGLNIRIVGIGDEGELKILHKVRGEAKAIAKLVDQMAKQKDLTGANVVISHVKNNPGATVMKHLIEKRHPEVNSVRIIDAGGLNSYYGENKGIIVGF